MKNRRKGLDKIDWTILNVLCFDYESIIQIYPLDEYPEISRDEVIDRLYNLFKKGYVCLMNDKEFNIEQIKNEPDDCEYSEFWYGITETGSEFWEENAERYAGIKIDWSDIWSEIIIYTEERGIIHATSPDTCLNRLKKCQEENKNEIIIDFDSVRISKVKEFEARYYKIIKNGYRLEFRFMKL